MTDVHAAYLEMAAGMTRSDPGALEWIRFTTGEGKTYASVEMDRDAGCSLAVALDHAKPDRAHDRLDEMTRRVMRARRRATETAAFVIEGQMPQWSYDVHTLLAMIITRLGGDPGLLTPDDQRESRRQILNLLLKPEATMGEVTESAGRIRVNALNVGAELTVWDNQTAGGVIIHNVSLPESVLGASAGRRLDEIVDHRAIGRSDDLVVTRAENLPAGGVKLMLRDHRTALGAVPEEASDTWRDMPY